jgi:hypothetical protein
MSKFSGLSFDCVAAQAHAEVGKTLSRVFKNKAMGLCLKIEDQMNLQRESQTAFCAPEFQPLHIQLQLMQNKVFHGVVHGCESLGDIDVALVRCSDGSSCYLFLPSEFARLCADLVSPGRSVRWSARASPPMIAGTSGPLPLFSPGESMSLVLKPHASENDALLVDLLNSGDLGSACVATVLQIMQPQSCTKYRAGLIRVSLYIHNCCNSEGTTRRDCRGILLLWDHQHGIAALFEEGDTLLLQFPVWVSSYDLLDVADWACGTVNPVLLEVGAQSVLFVHPAVLQRVVLTVTAGKLPLSSLHPENENAFLPQPQVVPINLHSCTLAKNAAQLLGAPTAIVADATFANAVVCPRIEALDLTFVHALPVPMLLCDAAAGMRGICSLVQILSCESVRLESVATAQVAQGLENSRIIVHGGGRGCDLSVSCVEADSREEGISSSQYMYKICDGWGFCNVLLPLAISSPSMLLHKTVLLDGFDCRDLVTRSGSLVGSEDSELQRCIVLIPNSYCRVLPITLNIGLALSAATHHGTFTLVIPAMESSTCNKSMVAMPRVCLPRWFPSHAVTATLLSVLQETEAEAAACRVVLQDKNGCAVRFTCSSLHQLRAVQLLPLVGRRVVCVFTLKRAADCIQVEGIYRC